MNFADIEFEFEFKIYCLACKRKYGGVIPELLLCMVILLYAAVGATGNV